MDGTYQLTGITQSHPMAILSNSVYLSYSGDDSTKLTTDKTPEILYVKTIGFTSPYYQFYSSISTSTTPSTLYVRTTGFSSPYYRFYSSYISSSILSQSDVILVSGVTYTFISAVSLGGHPFELYNAGGSYQLYNANDQFTYTVPEAINQLQYQCIAHGSSMRSSLSVESEYIIQNSYIKLQNLS